MARAEAAGDLWSRRIAGYPVWPHERLYRWRAEQFADAPDFVPLDRQGLVQMATRLARPVAASIGELARGAPPSRAGRDLWVLGSTGYRRQDAGGVQRCIYAEHLRRQLGDRLLFVETNASHLPAQGADDLVTIDAVLAAAMAWGRAMAPAYLARPSVRRQLRAFAPTPPETVVRDALYGRAVEALAHRWLRKANVRALFVLCAYNFFIPFQRAARSLGIPIIELQHGIIYDSHPGYILDGAPELPHLPDEIVVFGRHFGELLERECPLWAGRWTVGGHPWLRDRAAEATGERDLVVLFSAPDAPTRTRLAGAVPALRRGLPSSIRIVIKPHPLELDAERRYGAILGGGVELAGNLDDSYRLLARAVAAISVQSTVALEALAFGCHSIALTSRYWSGEIAEMVDRGAIAAAEDGVAAARIAARPVDRDRGAALAARLFGIAEPEPDFAALIDRVRASRRRVKVD